MRRIADEINRSETSILINLAHHPADAAFFERIIAMAIECYGEQPSVGSRIESHSLVHDVAIIPFRESDARGSFINRKGNDRLRPVATVFGSHDESLSGWLLLVLGIAQILKVEDCLIL